MMVFLLLILKKVNLQELLSTLMTGDMDLAGRTMTNEFPV
jgi:hypothetical protein